MQLFVTDCLAPFCVMLAYMSCAASLIGLCVLLLRRFLDTKIPPRWKSALWCLVFVALLVPYRVASPTAVLPQTPTYQFSQEEAQVRSEVLLYESGTQAHMDTSPQTVQSLIEEAEQLHWQSLVFEIALPLIWLAGVIAIGLYLLASRMYLHQHFCAQKKPCGARTQFILAQAQETLCTTRTISVFVQNYVQTPAITGLFRPMIILPYYAEDFDEETLHFILLHELSHYKRKDLWVHTLLLVLQTAYWFNPVIWLLFHFVRQDMELCNDDAVLRAIGRSAQKDYARSLVCVLGRYNHIAFAPRLLCMVDDKNNMKRRIEIMKSNPIFQKYRVGIAIAGVALICVLGALFLTKPLQSATENDGDSEAVSSAATAAPEENVAAAASSQNAAASSQEASPDATLNDDATEQTTITMVLEGYEEEVAATRVYKDGYSIAIPTEGWLALGENSWQAQANAQVTMEILCLTESDLQAVGQQCWGTQGTQSAWLDMTISYTSAQGQMYSLYALGGDANDIYYYALTQCSLEAVEGFGTRMAYIIQSVRFDEPVWEEVCLYRGNANADGLESMVVSAQITQTQDLVTLWSEYNGFTQDIRVLNHDGNRFDMSQGFGDLLSQTGTTGELLYSNAFVKTMLAYYGYEELWLTVEGDILETGHVIYDFAIVPEL